MLWVGSANKRGRIKCNKPAISWVEGKDFALGVWFATDRNVMLRSNYDDRIEKIKNVIEIWQLRKLTLLGKITHQKSFWSSNLFTFKLRFLLMRRHYRNSTNFSSNFFGTVKATRLKESLM